MPACRKLFQVARRSFRWFLEGCATIPIDTNPMDEYEEYFDAMLFVNDDYVEQTFEIGQDCQQTLLASSSASTDHDLTGQIVWPVSIFLAWFMSSKKEELKGKNVVELGAGAGLSGLAAAQYSHRTVLTDGNDIVLDLLEKNAKQYAINPDKVSVLPLLWGESASVHAFEAAFQASVDIIIGADVVCWPKLVKPLLQTIKYLMLRHPQPLTCRFYCGFVCRAQSTEDLLFQEAKSFGFNVTRIDDETFLPSPRPEQVVSHRELQLLSFQLDASKSNWDAPVEFSDAELDGLQTAC